MESKVNKSLIALVALMSAIIVAGVWWLFKFAPAEQTGLGWYLFAFATGLTMIVLPCTLPLAFVVVPLSMGKGIRKGLGIALAFAIGVTTTLSLYGAAAAIVGGLAVDSLGAPLETVKNWVYFIAGIFAYLFALGETGLIKLRMPSYTGAAPAFIQKQGDFIKPLLLGLFLGNIGVGCPHPATPMLLIEAGVNGNVFYGWSLFLIHAIGRVLPLLLLATLGIAGVNGLSWLISKKDKIERATGWAMVFVAGFIMTLGLFTHDWWVNSGIHTGLEAITQEETILNILGAKLGTGNTHQHGMEVGEGLFGLPLSLGNWWLVILWLIPIWWWWSRQKSHLKDIPESSVVPERSVRAEMVTSKKWSFITLSILLGLIFIYVLPTRFFHLSMMPHMDMEMDAHGGHTESHEESSVSEGVVNRFSIEPLPARVNQPQTLRFNVINLPSGAPVDNLQIEHEKFMHVIGMREDLTNFFHIHPIKTAPGAWEVPGMFREPGNYKVWSDIKTDDTIHSFGHSIFNVQDLAGNPGVSLRPNPEFGKVKQVEGYKVTLKTDPSLNQGFATNIGFDIVNALGVPASLDNILGAKMHLAVIKDDLSVYVHTHPFSGAGDHHASAAIPSYGLTASALAAADGHTDHTHGDVPAAAAVPASDGHTDHSHGTPEAAPFEAHVPFQATFPAAGVYKMFAQFRPSGIGLMDDQSLVAEFFVTVGSEVPRTPMTNPKGMLIVVSLVLMSGLAWGVNKYLKR